MKFLSALGDAAGNTAVMTILFFASFPVIAWVCSVIFRGLVSFLEFADRL